MTSWILTIPNHLMTQEICNQVVRNKLCMLFQDHFKTMEMCNEIMRTTTEAFHCISDCLKTQEMCKKVVEVDTSSLKLIPDHFKTQEICDKAVRDDSFSLQYVPDRCVTREGLYMWQIYEKLLPIAWHPDRVMDWCMSEDIVEIVEIICLYSLVKVSDVRFLSIKFSQKYINKDEFIFEKHNFKIIQRCINTRGSNTRCTCRMTVERT